MALMGAGECAKPLGGNAVCKKIEVERAELVWAVVSLWRSLLCVLEVAGSKRV